ncbi:hypothetical protein C7437_1011344 [Psychrobacillus insolitus]|uniref:Uncharacterized protein n=1 Tax=Psychrobacillus insolitus TaxID=1461 RepID=A0A2W7MNE6_9BACI|nr:hypothetical protein [Psychrobacillus insolitus]PZX08220.1 hypothetical protein C7437_1011344 [Psychrobacillus insolitus]
MKFKWLFWLSILSCLLLIFLQFFQWNLIEIFTPFFMPFVWFLVYGFFLVVFIVSIIWLFKKKDWKPFVVLIITILLLFLIPFNQIIIDKDFKENKSDRNEVIYKIKDGTFEPNVSYNSSLIHLPDEYEHLSKGGGDIVIEKQSESYSVLFFTFRGVLDGFSGFVYSPNDKKPQLDSFGGDFKEIVKIDEYWYFVSSS